MVIKLNLRTKMKRNMFMSAMALTAMFAAACSNEIENAPETTEGTVLTAGFASEAPARQSVQTKTVLENDKTVKWTKGDKIMVNGKISNAAEISGEGETATFSFGESLTAPYSAVFPSSIYTDAATVTLPAVQTYKAGSFAETAAPMCAYASEGTNLSFGHLCSVVKLTVNKPAVDAEKFSFIEFSGNGGEQICGNFAIDYEPGTLTPSATVADADKKIRYDVDWNIAADAQVVAYIVVPAGEYPQGFTVKIQDKQGRVMTQSSSAKTLKRGTVHEMPELSFEQTGTETGVEITTAAELIQFAKDYNSGVYAGSENSLVATLMNDIAFTDEENEAFVSIGNTGSNKFRGCFNGNSKTISNFNSGKALFASVNDVGIVKDLTVEGTASVTVKDADLSKSTDKNGNVLYDWFGGVLVDYNRGLVQRCTTNVAYTVNVAYSVKDVKGEKDEKDVKVTLCVGGIAARMPSCDGKIVGCLNNGTLTVMTKKGLSPETYIGGIVGLANGGNAEISDCISKCAIVSDRDDNTNKEYCGGIAGQSNAKIIGCDNYGKVVAKTYCKVRNVGGIAGANGGSVSGCDNYGEVVVAGAGRYVQLGGIIGSHSGTSELANIYNHGSVSLEKIQNNVSAVMKVGGCIGESTKDAATFGSNVANTGAVTVLSGQNWPNTKAVYVGGVFGYVASSVSGLVNEGAVSLENTHTPNLAAQVYLGGIIGCTEKAITIASCNNEKGSVTISHTEATLDTTTWWADGILGHGPDGVQEEESNIYDPEKVTMPELIIR